MIHLLSSAPFDIRKEVAYTLGNLCVAPAKNAEQPSIIVHHLVALVNRECISAFIHLVRSADIQSAKLGLQFLELVRKSYFVLGYSSEDYSAWLIFLPFSSNRWLGDDQYSLEYLYYRWFMIRLFRYIFAILYDTLISTLTMKKWIGDLKYYSVMKVMFPRMNNTSYWTRRLHIGEVTYLRREV